MFVLGDAKSTFSSHRFRPHCERATKQPNQTTIVCLFGGGCAGEWIYRRNTNSVKYTLSPPEHPRTEAAPAKVE